MNEKKSFQINSNVIINCVVQHDNNVVHAITSITPQKWNENLLHVIIHGARFPFLSSLLTKKTNSYHAKNNFFYMSIITCIINMLSDRHWFHWINGLRLFVSFLWLKIYITTHDKSCYNIYSFFTQFSIPFVCSPLGFFFLLALSVVNHKQIHQFSIRYAVGMFVVVTLIFWITYYCHRNKHQIT